MARLVPLVEVQGFIKPLEEGKDYAEETYRIELQPDNRISFPTGVEFDARELREALDLLIKGKGNGQQPFNPHQNSVLPHLQPGHNYRGPMNVFTGGREPTPADESS